MSFPRYPKYKASGVEWLEEVPEDWTTSRLGFEAWVRARLGWKGLKADEYVDEGFAFLSTTNIKARSIDFQDVNLITRERFEESPEIQLRAGDVLLAKDGSLGTVNVVRYLPRPATVNSSIAVITPGRRLSSVFLCYLFESSYMKNTIQRTKGGMGVPHLFQDDLNKFFVPLPSFDEQTAIAEFLDRETAKIDVLVAEQERLIALLKEKRQAVISHAVTKGLNPNAPMKPSGIEWLGDVPAHWKVRRLSPLSTKITNGFVGPTRDILTDDGIRYLQSLHIKGNEIRFDVPYFVSAEWSARHSKSILEVGDVLIVQTGDIGQVTVVTEEFAGCNCHALIIVAPVRAIVDGRWISWVLNSDYGVQVLRSIQTGALHPHLNCGDVKDIPIPVPSLEEQRCVVENIVARVRDFDGLTAEAQSAIDLLQARRTALISAAVTGQIDVRGLASHDSAA